MASQDHKKEGMELFRCALMATFAALAVLVATPVTALALDTQEVYRLCNPYTGEHLLTTDTNEYQQLDRAGWDGEGARFEVPALGGVSIYRLYNPNNSDHHYTTDLNEYNTLQRPEYGWQGEGVKLYGQDPASLRAQPIYRLWNSQQTTNGGLGSHLWTSDRNEYDTLPVQSGGAWRQEDVAFCAVGPEVEKITYSSDVKTVDDASFGTPSADGYVSTVILPPSEGASVAVGQTLVVEGNGESPSATAMVVTNVTKTPDGYRVSGTKPEVEDLVESIQIAGTARDMEDVVTAQGVSILSSDPEGSTVTLSINSKTLQDEGIVTLDSGSYTGDEHTVEIAKDITLSFTPSFDYEYDYSWFTLHSARFAANLNTKLQADVSFDRDFKQDLFTATFPINGALSIEVKFALVCNVHGEVEVHATANYTGGFQYRENEGIEPVFNKSLDWGASMAGELSGGVRPSAMLKLFNIGNLAYLDLEGGITLEGTQTLRNTGMVCCDASAYFYAKASIGNEGNLVGDALKLFNQPTTFDLIGKGSDGNLFDAHMENGKLVKKCTWKELQPGTSPDEQITGNPATDICSTKPTYLLTHVTCIRDGQRRRDQFEWDYTYDAQGNLLSSQHSTFTYDDANNLLTKKSSRDGNSSTATFSNPELYEDNGGITYSIRGDAPYGWEGTERFVLDPTTYDLRQVIYDYHYETNGGSPGQSSEVVYEFGDDSVWDSIKGPGGDSVITYDANGCISSVRYSDIVAGNRYYEYTYEPSYTCTYLNRARSVARMNLFHVATSGYEFMEPLSMAMSGEYEAIYGID